MKNIYSYSRKKDIIVAILCSISLFVNLRASVAAPYESKNCMFELQKYQSSGNDATFEIALRCDSDSGEKFPLGEALLLGMTATSSAKEEEDSAKLEYDFAVQHFSVKRDSAQELFTFRGQLNEINGNYVYVRAWPLDFLRNCTKGRSGCRKYGYALERPSVLPKFCITKSEEGYSETSEELLCSGSKRYRFKFR